MTGEMWQQECEADLAVGKRGITFILYPGNTQREQDMGRG